MALWKDQPQKSPSGSPEVKQPMRFDADPAPARVEPVHEAPAPVATVSAVPAANTRATPVREKSRAESLIAPDIAIEGKIEGSGHVRIAGRFKGDVDVRGDLTIEPGAKVTGSVRAEKIVISGELVGNIEAASHVDLMQSGALTGDLKAATLTVTAGSRMRGMAEFGWDDDNKPEGAKSNGRNGADRGGTT